MAATFPSDSPTLVDDSRRTKALVGASLATLLLVGCGSSPASAAAQKRAAQITSEFRRQSTLQLGAGGRLIGLISNVNITCEDQSTDHFNCQATWTETGTAWCPYMCTYHDGYSAAITADHLMWFVVAGTEKRVSSDVS